jgi:hypothetical protein
MLHPYKVNFGIQRRAGSLVKSVFSKRGQNLKFGAVSVLIACACSLAENSGIDSVQIAAQPIIGGYAALEFGQLVKARYRQMDFSGGDFRNLWVSHEYLSFSVKHSIGDHLTLLGSLEARMWYNSVPFSFNPDQTEGFPRQNFDITFPAAAGIIHFGRISQPEFSLTVGRFEYKYNDEARNLGEYLFRTGSYPGYVITNFDLPLARLSGIKASLRFPDFLEQNLLLTTLREIRPFYDLSVSYLAKASIGKIARIGAGVSFDNCVDAEIPENSVTKSYAQNGYLTSPTDTGYYTFKGTKLLAHVTIDPKSFFRYSPFFGDEDLKIYGEAAILGLKDYPASNAFDSLNNSNPWGYDDLSKRIPAMIGINLPTHQLLSYCILPAILGYELEFNADRKLGKTLTCGLPGLVLGVGSWVLDHFCGTNTRLDLISLEAEWYGCPYQDSYANPMTNGLPVPSTIRTPGYSDDKGEISYDDVKWSLFAKKRFLKNGEIIVQFARDHSRSDIQLKKYSDFQAALVRPAHWYWMSKIKFYF